MATKIEYWQVLLYLIIITGLSVVSCKTLTIQEFEEEYDAVEINAEIIDHNTKGSAKFIFFYNDTTYTISISAPPYLPNGRKYKILIDKENPDRHYIVLLYKPVFLDTIPLDTALILITDYFEGTNEVWVYYEIIRKSGAEKQIINHGTEFFEDIKYYDKIKKYKDDKTEVVIEVYRTQHISDNQAKVAYKINYEETDNLNK